jgi:type IV pilus assembly protein PilA
MQNTKKNKSGPTRACFQDGFTLLEILLVVGIIAILAGIVIVAINPARQLAQARNTERISGIKQINNALQQYYIEHGSYPASLTTTLTEICNTGASTSVSSGYCTGKINLSELVPTYITAIPKDPQATTTNSAGYKVAKDTTNKLVTTAPQAELEVNIAIGTSTAAAVASTLGDGLVAHWKMNDTSGTTVVDTKGKNGVSVSAVSSVTGVSASTGGSNGALRFNGAPATNVTITGYKGISSPPYSVSFWFKFPNANGTEQAFLSWGSPNGNGNWAEFESHPLYPGKIFMQTGGGSGGPQPNIYTSSRYDDNSWHHFVCTVDSSGNVRMYVDTSSQYTDGAFSLHPLLNYDMTIGYRNYYNDSFLNGHMDDVRIYDRVLTTDEITQLYNGGSGTEAE